MGSIGEPQPKSSAIPVVDFAKWNNSTSREDQLAVAKELTEACRSVGFVYIINHGLPQDLLDQAFDTGRRLFALSLEEKNLAPHPPTPEVHRGYSSPGMEKVSQYMGGKEDDDEVGERMREVADCKESYEIGSQDDKLQPNVWLPPNVLPGFRDFTQMFYWECHKVALSILRAMALGIGMDDLDFFEQFHSGNNCQLRLLHYPPIPAAEIENHKAERMPAHTDWSTITMLFQDDCGGLEVEDPHEAGKFIPATPMPGACVMNVGDMLMRWSNDYLKSTKHRVGLPPLADRFEGEQRMTRPRYSIPFFVSPDADALVKVLPPCTNSSNPAKYEPITQYDYGRMRQATQYRKAEPVAAAA